MSTENWLELINQVPKEVEYDMGGEPLVYKDFEKFLWKLTNIVKLI